MKTCAVYLLFMLLTLSFTVTAESISTTEGFEIRLLKADEDSEETRSQWWLTFPDGTPLEKPEGEGDGLTDLRFFVPSDHIERRHGVLGFDVVRLQLHVEKPYPLFDTKVAKYLNMGQRNYHFLIELRLKQDKPTYRVIPTRWLALFADMRYVPYETCAEIADGSYVLIQLRPFEIHDLLAIINARNPPRPSPERPYYTYYWGYYPLWSYYPLWGYFPLWGYPTSSGYSYYDYHSQNTNPISHYKQQEHSAAKTEQTTPSKQRAEPAAEALTENKAAQTEKASPETPPSEKQDTPKPSKWNWFGRK